MNYMLLATSNSKFNIENENYYLMETYSNMKLQIGLAPNQITIHYKGNAKIHVEKLFDDAKGLYRAAFQYAYLAYILYFGQPINFKSIYLQMDNQEAEMYQSNVYTLLRFNEFHRFEINKLDLREKIDDYLFITKEGQQSNQYIALVNLFISKSQTHQIDRFSYLWRAYNALYRLISKSLNYNRENRMIATIEKYQYTGDVLGDIVVFDKAERDKMCIEFIRRYMRSFINNLEEKSNINNSVYESFLKKHNYPYDILTFIQNQLAYYYRCSLFHGKEIYAFMVFDRDETYQILKYINVLLDNSIMLLLTKIQDFIDK